MASNEVRNDDCHRKKLLYIMGIDWNWIFQRPQIIEQHLERTYDVTVVFPRSILRWHNRPRVRYPQDYRILWTLPLQEKNKFISCLVALWSKRLFRDIHEYDVVWIGYPLYYRYIPESYGGKVIYDCMDNHEALYPDQKRINRLLCQETALVSHCDRLIVTGTKLSRKMEAWSGSRHKIALVRNGTTLDKVISPCPFVSKKKYKLGYFGTIAEWFDYELLVESLAEISCIEYHLIGPVTKVYKTTSTNIFFEGTVEHSDLPEVTKDYDCLLMPFKVDDIVQWVDPVKLYEYIALGKCIIAPKYAEIEHFKDYVYFYSSHREYIQLINKLIPLGFPPKYSSSQQEYFLRNNSWEARFKEIDLILNNL